ncbi:MAG: hypothetical protein ACYDCK_08715 [Thermoplasmatota archaeon]
MPRDAPAYESSLAVPVGRYFERGGARVFFEVPFNRRVADVIAIAKDGTVDAVELKLADWRGAHAQAKAYQLGAHRSWVALPVGKCAKVATRESTQATHRASGVGLLSVDGDAVSVVIAARASERRLDFMSDWLSRIGAVADRNTEGTESTETTERH